MSFFKFPRDDRLKKFWVDFVQSHLGDFRITANTRLCSAHFTTDNFTNYHEVQSGFMDSRLVLVTEAVPTLSLPVPHPRDIAASDIAASDIAISTGGIMRPRNGVSSLVCLYFIALS